MFQEHIFCFQEYQTKVKVKSLRLKKRHGLKAYGGTEIQFYTFLRQNIMELSIQPRPFCPLRNILLYPLDRRLGEFQV